MSTLHYCQNWALQRNIHYKDKKLQIVTWALAVSYIIWLHTSKHIQWWNPGSSEGRNTRRHGHCMTLWGMSCCEIRYTALSEQIDAALPNNILQIHLISIHAVSRHSLYSYMAITVRCEMVPLQFLPMQFKECISCRAYFFAPCTVIQLYDRNQQNASC